MGGDQWIFYLFIGMPLLLIIFALAVHWMSSSSNRFSCPVCHEHLPLTAIHLEGVHCHHCDWRVEHCDEDEIVGNSSQKETL